MRLPSTFSPTLSVRNTLLAGAFALTTLVAAGAAQAGVAMPAIGSAMPKVETAENVRWVCGLFHCYWRPNYRYWYVPPYARAWGPPGDPACFWRRGYGGWGQVCP